MNPSLLHITLAKTISDEQNRRNRRRRLGRR
jgi:hypothetical protein